MKISVVIPTLNRQDSLQKCIKSIIQNTLHAHEIIVVEQGNILKTQKMIKNLGFDSVQTIHQQTKSIALARKTGAMHAGGDIIVFLDDDFVLDKRYLENLIILFDKYKSVKAMGGSFYISKKSFLSELIASLFCSENIFAKNNKIILSGYNLLRMSDKNTFVDWLSGGNMAIKKEVIRENPDIFPDDFRSYSLFEDVYISYSIRKKFGKKSLLQSSILKAEHTENTSGHINEQVFIKMRIIYKFAFFVRVFKPKIYNWLCYILSEILLSFYYVVKSKNKLNALKNTIQSYMFVAKNKQNIINKKQEVYNDFIFA